jgi:hypothetical protein
MKLSRLWRHGARVRGTSHERVSKRLDLLYFLLLFKGLWTFTGARAIEPGTVEEESMRILRLGDGEKTG